MKTIEYNGQTLTSKHCREMSDEKFQELRANYYQKPEFGLVEKELFKLANGGVKMTNIERYYVKDLMAKVTMNHSKWCIEDVFNYKPLLETFYAKIITNDKVYPVDKSEITNIETAFRLGGKGVAVKPSNFPIKTVDNILEMYNVNNNYYDFSCGWGVRLLGSLRNNVNYFGTDPNYLLTERLETLTNDYKRINNSAVNVDIRTVGSQEFQSDWVNTMGLAFSSPPYFDLEDYKVGNQSYKQGTGYDEWLNGYFGVTLDNIKEYLIEGGYLAININNTNKQDLVGDTKRLALEKGFTYIDTHTLKNIQRIGSKKQLNDNSEGIMVFQKSTK